MVLEPFDHAKVNGETLAELVTDTEADPLPDPQVSDMEVVARVTGLWLILSVTD